MKTQLFFTSLLVATALVGCTKRDDARESQSAYGATAASAAAEGAGNTLSDNDSVASADNYGSAHGHDGDLGEIEPEGDQAVRGGLGVGTRADLAPLGEGESAEDRARSLAGKGEVYDTGAAAAGNGQVASSASNVDGAALGALIAHRQQGLELAKLGEKKASKPALRQIASSLRVADQEALELLREQRNSSGAVASSSAGSSSSGEPRDGAATVNGRSGGFGSWPVSESARAAEVSESNVGNANDLSRDIDFTQPDPATTGTQMAMTDDDFFDSTTRSSASGNDEAPVLGSVGAQNDPATVAPVMPAGMSGSATNTSVQAGSPGGAVDFSALRSATGPKFDALYVDAVLAHHQAGQSLAQSASSISGMADVTDSERQAVAQLQSWRQKQVK